jgi:hypothetical protein
LFLERQIGDVIGSLSYPAVSDAVRRTTARLERDDSLQKRLRRVLRPLNLLDATPSARRELRGRRLVQVIDLARIGRDESVQSVKFLGIAQLFQKHDLADLFGNSHGSILSELRVSR